MYTTYLIVPAGEEDEARAAGVLWDDRYAYWYVIDPQPRPSRFSRWLPPATPAGEHDWRDVLIVASNDACVATTVSPCQQCGSPIQLVCLYLPSCLIYDAPWLQTTVFGILAMDAPLAEHLELWPQLRRVCGDIDGPLVNVCLHCDAPQDDMALHVAPEHPFFDVPQRVVSGDVSLVPLHGPVRLSGSISLLPSMKPGPREGGMDPDEPDPRRGSLIRRVSVRRTHASDRPRHGAPARRRIH